MIVIHFISVRYKTMCFFTGIQPWRSTGFPKFCSMDFIRTTKLSNINFANSNCSIHTAGGEGDSETESTGHPVTLEAQNHFLLRCATPIYPCPNKLIFWSGKIKFSKQWKYHVSYFLKYLCIFWTFFFEDTPSPEMRPKAKDPGNERIRNGHFFPEILRS